MKKPKPRRPLPVQARPVRQVDWSWLYVPTAWTLITVSALAAYANSFQGRLFFDDISSVLGNPHLQVLVNPHYWEADRRWTEGGLVNAMRADIDTPFSGRPIVSLSFALNHWWAFSQHPAEIPEFYGVLQPHYWYYHVVNFGFHLAVGLLLWHFLRRTFRAPNVAEFTGRYAELWATAIALIWTVHPINTETVVYVTQRTEQVVSFFLLLTMYCGSRSITSRFAPAWMVAAVVACSLGMASKENMVVAPLLIVLYDRAFYFSTWRDAFLKRWPFYIPIYLTYVVLILVNPGLFLGQGPRSMSVGFGFERMGWVEYLITQCWCLLRYLRLTVVPTGLCVDYGRLAILDLPHVVPGAIVVLSLLALTVWGWIKQPWLGFLGCWFFFILAPTSSIIPIVTEVGAERRMYLPVAAVLVGIAAALMYGLRKIQVRRGESDVATEVFACWGAIAVLALVAAGFGYWYAEKNYWFPVAAVTLCLAAFSLVALRALDKSKDSSFGPIGATAVCAGILFLTISFAFISYWRNDEYLTDSKLYGHIPRVFPWNERGCNNYAKICIDEGRIDEAEQLLNQALKIDPEYSDAFTNRGIVYHRRQQYDRAIANATEAIRWNPLNPSAWNNRGNALIELKLFDAAIADFTQLTVMNPRGVEGYYGRANTFFVWGKLDEALEDIQNVIQRSPGDYKAFNTKGNIIKQQAVKLREEKKNEQAVARLLDAVAVFNSAVDLLIREARSAHFPNLAAVEECLNGNLSRHQQAMTFANRFTLATIFANRADAYRNLIDDRVKAKENMFDDLTRAIIMHPENPNYFMARGQMHFNVKSYPQALSDFEDALRRQPNSGDALRGRILAAYELKNWDVVWQTAKMFRDGGRPVDDETLKKWREESGRDYPP